jgi:hypothetical protein
LATSSAAPPLERRAAAQADDAVGAVRAEHRGAVHHLPRRRVAGHPRVHRDLQARQQRTELGEHGERFQRLVGDDQRTGEPAIAQVRRHFLAGAGPEADGGGEGKARQRHVLVALQMISK